MPLFNAQLSRVPSNLLKDKYGWPPFSILNTISWDWQRRKDEWESIIGDSTEGRDVKRYNATPTNTFSSRGKDAKTPESISEFDPYLSELMYRWFSVRGAKVLDPFAGGCVRGIVASILSRNYTGIDLSPIQVSVNQEKYHNLNTKFEDVGGIAEWINGDSDEILSKLSPEYDMIFTCPPYYNLEKYSKDPKDLSNAPSYDEFLYKYESILRQSADLLKDDSFFVIVVSEVRKTAYDIANSEYVGLVPDTINILRNSGLKYYNEIILENSIGSLPMRAPRYFNRLRKVGRHHQNILVFYKGNICSIEEKFGKVYKVEE